MDIPGQSASKVYFFKNAIKAYDSTLTELVNDSDSDLK
jgi:hypothetical protein